MQWADAEAGVYAVAVAVVVPDLDLGPKLVELASHPGRKCTTLDLQDARSPQGSCTSNYYEGMLAG